MPELAASRTAASAHSGRRDRLMRWIRRSLGGLSAYAAMTAGVAVAQSGPLPPAAYQPPPTAMGYAAASPNAYPTAATGVQPAGHRFASGYQPAESPTYCPPTSYERLPDRGEAFARLFATDGTSPLSGVYGRLEYLAIRTDDDNVRFGQFVPNFDPRTTRAAFLRTQPAFPLLRGDQPDLTDEDPFLISRTQPFRRGVPIVINNPIRGIAFDPDSQSIPVVNSSEPVAAQIEIPDFDLGTSVTNGIRGVVGMPFRYGFMEASVFGMERQQDSAAFRFADGGIRGLGIVNNFDDDLQNLDDTGDSIVNADAAIRQLVGIPFIFTDPIPLDATILPENTPITELPNYTEVEAPRQGFAIFDQAFSIDQSTELNGAGGDIFWTLRPGQNWRIFGLTGFQFTQLGDDMQAVGVASEDLNVQLRAVDEEARVGVLEADTRNRLYMGQFGFRTEATFGYLTLGIQPQVGLGGSRRTAETFSAGLLPGGTPLSDSTSETVFSATFELSTYARLQVRDWLFLNVGYEYTNLGDVYRPSSVIDYTTVSTNPNISATGGTTSFSWDQFFVGCEVLLP